MREGERCERKRRREKTERIRKKMKLIKKASERERKRERERRHLICSNPYKFSFISVKRRDLKNAIFYLVIG